MFVALQSILYLNPKPAASDVLSRLARAIPKIADRAGIELIGMREVDVAILEGDEQAFASTGSQLFLSYEDKGRCTMWISLFSSDPECSVLYFQPDLPGTAKDLINHVWARTLQMTTALIEVFDPALAEVNGLDDPEDGPFAGGDDEDWDDEEERPRLASVATVKRGSIPDVVTPFTYLVDPGGERLAAAARATGACRIEKLAAGHSVQFVAGLYARPPATLQEELERALGEAAPFYSQVGPDEA